MFCAKPALHRYPAAMARRVHELCVHSSTTTTATRRKVWRRRPLGDELFRRLRELPGFGEEKAKIFLAMLAKRLGDQPPGWEERAGPFSDDAAPLGRRHRLPRDAGQGARVEEGPEGRGQGQGRLNRRRQTSAEATVKAKSLGRPALCRGVGGRASRAGRRRPVGRGAGRGRLRR